MLLYGFGFKMSQDGGVKYIYPTVVTSGIRQRTFVSSVVSYFVCSFILRACKELKLFLIRKNC